MSNPQPSVPQPPGIQPEFVFCGDSISIISQDLKTFQMTQHIRFLQNNIIFLFRKGVQARWILPMLALLRVLSFSSF